MGPSVVGIQNYKSVSAFAIAAPLLLLSASELCIAQQPVAKPGASAQAKTQQISSSSQANGAVSTALKMDEQAIDAATIVDRMLQAYADDAAQRRAYNLTRNYRIYEGSAPTVKSEITAVVNFLPPQSKSFSIVQSTGGMAERMVRKALEREVDLAKDPTVSQIVPANYGFEYAGEDFVQGKRCYVLLLHPRRRVKDLLKGRVWIDAERFSIRQVEGEPAAMPSWWVKNVHLLLSYKDVNGMWIQTGTEATAHIRMAGDYKMVSRDVRFDSAETVSDLLRPDRVSGSSSMPSAPKFSRRHGITPLRNAP